jgi:hypothetical protein
LTALEVELFVRSCKRLHGSSNGVDDFLSRTLAV